MAYIPLRTDPYIGESLFRLNDMVMKEEIPYNRELLTKIISIEWDKELPQYEYMHRMMLKFNDYLPKDRYFRKLENMIFYKEYDFIHDILDIFDSFLDISYKIGYETVHNERSDCEDYIQKIYDMLMLFPIDMDRHNLLVRIGNKFNERSQINKQIYSIYTDIERDASVRHHVGGDYMSIINITNNLDRYIKEAIIHPDIPTRIDPMDVEVRLFKPEIRSIKDRHFTKEAIVKCCQNYKYQNYVKE